MQIYINKSTSQNPDWQLAVLKEGTSFEYVSENRLFSGSDGYTLAISFPLKDSPQNLAIFGNINRADVLAGKVVFDCEIRDKAFAKYGCVTVTEINEAEVSVQFLDGRSEQNFDKTLDKIYINELDLGEPPQTTTRNITPAEAWRGLNYGLNSVALPWVNDSSRNIQNQVVYENGDFRWHSDIRTLSWQPYLLYITMKICEQIDYSYDFSDWESREEYKYLLICNTLPSTWGLGNFARALPHWSVEEYFTKLELLLGCEFDFDHRGRNIRFAFTRDILDGKTPILLDNIVDEHSTEVKVGEEGSDYCEARNLAYKECSHRMWKFYSCDWFMKTWKSEAIIFNTMDELLDAVRPLHHMRSDFMHSNLLHNLLYAADVDTYFTLRTLDRVDTGDRRMGGVIVWDYTLGLQSVNILGPRIVNDDENADCDEIEFVPVRLDYTDEENGTCVFLDFSGYDEPDRDTPVLSENRTERINQSFYSTFVEVTLAAGEEKKKAEYYDCIYIAWWDGATENGSVLPPTSSCRRHCRQ